MESCERCGAMHAEVLELRATVARLTQQLSASGGGDAVVATSEETRLPSEETGVCKEGDATRAQACTSGTCSFPAAPLPLGGAATDLPVEAKAAVEAAVEAAVGGEGGGGEDRPATCLEESLNEDTNTEQSIESKTIAPTCDDVAGLMEGLELSTPQSQGSKHRLRSPPANRHASRSTQRHVRTPGSRARGLDFSSAA